MPEVRLRGGVRRDAADGLWRSIIEVAGVEYLGKTAHASEEGAMKEYQAIRATIFPILEEQARKGNVTIKRNLPHEEDS